MSNDTHTVERRDGLPDSRLDMAIDHAVRQMMRVDPPTGFCGRVMRQLESPAPRTGFVAQFAFAGAALAAVLIAIVMMRPGAPGPASEPPPRVAVVHPARPVETAPPPVAPATVPATTPKAAPTGVRREPLPPAPRVAEVFGQRDGRVAAANIPSGDELARRPVPAEIFELSPSGVPSLRVTEFPIGALLRIPVRIPATRPSRWMPKELERPVGGGSLWR
jgi:hypothetical protein